MTQPGHRYADCRCGHTKLQHDPLAPQCSAAACTCLHYRPVTDTAPAPRATPSPAGAPSALRPPITVAPSSDQLIAAGRRSESKRTQQLAAKAHDAMNALRERLREEHANAAAKRHAEEQRAAALREVAELEEKLREAKARARGVVAPAATPRPTPPADGELTCPEPGCESRTFATERALGIHRSHSHKAA